VVAGAGLDAGAAGVVAGAGVVVRGPGMGPGDKVDLLYLSLVVGSP